MARQIERRKSMRTSRTPLVAPGGHSARSSTSVKSVASERSVDMGSVHSSETEPQQYHMAEFARKYFREAILRLILKKFTHWGMCFGHCSCTNKDWALCRKLVNSTIV